MNIKIKLRPFMVPNFVISETKPGQKQDGFKEAPSYPLKDLDEETLAGLCKEFTESVFEKAGKTQP